MNQVAAAKVKSESILQKQMKIENSNEIYGVGSKQSFDIAKMESFVKKEEKPTSFLGGLSQDVTTINFNTIEPSQQASSSGTKHSTSKQNLAEYENASKKRKLKVVPNATSSQVSFVVMQEPVRVDKSIFEKVMPEDRKEFLLVVS